MNDYLLGIDPGWKNCGYALLRLLSDGQLETVMIGVDDPSVHGSDYPSYFSQRLRAVIQSNPGKILASTIERYVPYSNTFTAESENITLTIGGIREALRPWSMESSNYGEGKLIMTRAIDWKVSLVKTLVKNTGFDNPSPSLDKRYSIAAATHILNGKYEFKTDHEADAVCLAAFPKLLEKYPAPPKRR